MTSTLQEAFKRALVLPEEEQEALPAMMIPYEIPDHGTRRPIYSVRIGVNW